MAHLLFAVWYPAGIVFGFLVMLAAVLLLVALMVAGKLLYVRGVVGNEVGSG